MEKIIIKTPCRSEPIITIASKWWKACRARGIDQRPVAYIYWMSCGFWPTDEQRAVILEWLPRLDLSKPEAVTVMDYLRVMGLTRSALDSKIMHDIY